MLHFIAPLENIDVQRTVFKITLKSLLLQECEQSLFQDTYVRILFTFFIVQNSFYFDDFFADLIFKHCGYAQ